MRTIVVDRDPNTNEELVRRFRSEGQEAQGLGSVEEAHRELDDVEEPIMLFLSHDLGGGQHGYDLCKWLRQAHPFGLLLPIIYVTDSETPEQFLAQQRHEPFTHPSAFVTRAELAQDKELLPKLLQEQQEQFEQACLWFEQQSARQALLSLAEMDPDVIDAP